jgi:hypothetical protein
MKHGVVIPFGILVVPLEHLALSAGPLAWAYDLGGTIIGQTAKRNKSGNGRHKPNEIPQAANRLLGGVRHRLCAADRVVGAELFNALSDRHSAHRHVKPRSRLYWRNFFRDRQNNNSD